MQPGRSDYVWGPDYVDELIAQVADADGDAGTAPDTYFYLQDANYNVVAVLDVSGNVLTQYTYTPYGELIHVDDLTGGADAPVNRFTHQGLPFERFYAESGADFGTSPILIGVNLGTGEFALGLHYNRNRWYSPELGRFTSADPNATAMPIVTALAFNAEALDTLLSAFDAASHFGDGMTSTAISAPTRSTGSMRWGCGDGR